VRDTPVNFLINASRFKKCFQSAAINFYDWPRPRHRLDSTAPQPRLHKHSIFFFFSASRQSGNFSIGRDCIPTFSSRASAAAGKNTSAPNEIKLKSPPEINFAHHQATCNICVGRFTLMTPIITSEGSTLLAEMNA
jgi:hypothetical protein